MLELPPRPLALAGPVPASGSGPARLPDPSTGSANTPGAPMVDVPILRHSWAEATYAPPIPTMYTVAGMQMPPPGA